MRACTSDRLSDAQCEKEKKNQNLIDEWMKQHETKKYT